MSLADGSTQALLDVFQSAPLATLTTWSFVLSKLMLADAPLMVTDACVLMSRKKLLPVVVLTLAWLGVRVPLPAAMAVSGAITDATRNMAPADSAASLDRFTWLSLSGIGGRSRRRATTSAPGARRCSAARTTT